jgi:manganese transport protein
MSRLIALRSRLLSVLFWSVIAAAFIGPGTVTTAAAAGALFKLDLLWAIVFSTVACLLLQEAAARITIVSGYSLGGALAFRFGGRRTSHPLTLAVAVSIVFGCAAYQTGNILGAVAGLSLLWPLDPRIFTLAVSGVCGLLLWMGTYRSIANFLGLIVALMGAAFLAVALTLDFSSTDLLAASVQLTMPSGGNLLLIGLIGTTIVPYNLFLGSGISQGQPLGEMRFGITVAVLIGGGISAAILLVGTLVEGPFQYEALVAQLTGRLGIWAGYLFGVGLFAAGFTSCVTAPLASAVTVQSLFQKVSDKPKTIYWRYRFAWIAVLLTGFLFGMAGYRPVPVIILAQGINGLLLPFIVVLLLLMVNDPVLMPAKHLNSKLNNLLMLFITGLTIFLGLTNVVKAVSSALVLDFPEGNGLLLMQLFLSGGFILFLSWLVIKRRNPLNHPPQSPEGL